MSELKKCPFCGGKPVLLKHNDEDYYKVFCECCGARQWTFANRTDRDAIRNWNTRTPMDNIVEKLEESQERYDGVAFMEMNTNGHTLDFEYAHGKKDGVQEAINIVKQEINNGLE